MSDLFYRALEDRFRGSEGTIKSRLGVYIPFVAPLTDLYSTPTLLDAGCGRGEWLELMQELGFEVFGVDLDDGMLRSCYEKNLPVEKGDAIDYLSHLPDESRTVVSAFHVVEHVPFERLRSLVSESLRVLKPGGLLIMETPNPENIAVGTANFYLDPTHRCPIPHQLLSFIAEHAGFERVKTLRLQESAELLSEGKISLLDVLEGSSPDYSIVAQKKAEREQMEKFDGAFSKQYGISMNELADRYKDQSRWVEERAKLDETISGQKAELDRLKKGLAEASEEISALNHTVQADAAARHEDELKWAEERADLNKTIAVQKAELGRVEKGLAEATEKIAELNHVAQADLAARHENELKWAEERSELNGTVAVQKAELGRLEKEMAEAAEKIAELNESSHHWWTVAEGLTKELNDSRERSQWLENEWTAAKFKIDELGHSSHHWWTVADALREQLEEVHGSRCVRWTAPLRWISMQLRRLRHEGLFARLKALVKKILRAFARKAVRFVFRHPRLKEWGGIRLKKHPRLDAKIRRFSFENELPCDSMPVDSPAVSRSEGAADHLVGELCTGYPKQSFSGELHEITGVCCPEPWGYWSDGDCVVFQFTEPLPEQFSLHLTARAFGPNIGKAFIASVGDSRGSFCLGSEPTHCAVDLSNPDRLNTLQIHIPEPTAPADISESDDRRKLGLGLCEMHAGVNGQVVVVDFLGRERHRMSLRAKSIYCDLKKLISEKESECA